MSEYGKGYILKSTLLDAVDWDNDIGKWVIWDDDLQSLVTQKNDVVEVVRCEDCKHMRTISGEVWGIDTELYYCGENEILVSLVGYCSDGEPKDGGKNND